MTWVLIGTLLGLPLSGLAIPNLFVSNLNSNSVLEYNGTTGASLGTFAIGGGLNGPEGVTFGPNGNLFVSSGLTNSVLEYNGTTGAVIGTFASGGGLNGPVGLTFGPNGNLFVSSFNANSVLQYNGTTGALVGAFASGGGLNGPSFLTFGPSVAIPEPASLVLLGLGLAGLAAWRQWRML